MNLLYSVADVSIETFGSVVDVTKDNFTVCMIMNVFRVNIQLIVNDLRDLNTKHYST